MKRYTALILTLTAVLLVSLVVAGGCGGGKSTPRASQSANQSTSATKVTVQQVSTNPSNYDGQEIATEGDYAAGYCSACFLLKDGVSSLRVEVTDLAPMPPESKLNSRMEVTGKIYIAKGSPNLVANKIVYK